MKKMLMIAALAVMGSVAYSGEGAIANNGYGVYVPELHEPAYSTDSGGSAMDLLDTINKLFPVK